MDPRQAVRFVARNRRAVMHTYRADGGPQLSPVLAGVDGEGRVIVSTRETTAKVANLRRRPEAALCVFTDAFFGDWVHVSGPVEIVSMPEALEPLIDYYRRVAGEHPDWREYAEAMARERRVLLRMTVVEAAGSIRPNGDT